MIIEIEVPDNLIKFNDVTFHPNNNSDSSPKVYEVGYSDYYIEGLPEQFKIIHGDETELDALAIQQESGQ